MTARAVALLSLLPALALAQPRGGADKVPLELTHVAGSVHMLEGAGGNIGVSAGPDGLLLIDDEFDWLAPRIRAELKKLSKAKVQWVLNTHWHGDHTGANAFFGKEGRIVAHAHVRQRLLEGAKTPERTIPPAPPEALPVITYEDGLSLWFNGEEVRVLHLPTGHTDGDSMVLFTRSKVAHLGDHFFVDRFPFVDLASGGDVEGYVKNVGRVLELLPKDVRIIPGHGRLATREDLERFHSVLKDTVETVRRAMTAGQSLEQVKAAGLPPQYAEWGSGFIKTDVWLETIYKSLQARAAPTMGRP